MKKFILYTILISSLNFKTPSASACGVFTAPVGGGLIATGICLIAGSPITGLVGVGIPVSFVTEGILVSISGKGKDSGTGMIAAGIGGIGAIVGAIASVTCGILLLEDDNGNKDFEFIEISKKDANKLNINEEQLNIYNENIEELNVLKENVVSYLKTISKERELTAEDSRNAWVLVADEIENLGVSLSTLSIIITGSNI